MENQHRDFVDINDDDLRQEAFDMAWRKPQTSIALSLLLISRDLSALQSGVDVNATGLEAAIDNLARYTSRD